MVVRPQLRRLLVLAACLFSKHRRGQAGGAIYMGTGTAKSGTSGLVTIAIGQL
jgi:hypothetical protein